MRYRRKHASSRPNRKLWSDLFTKSRVHPDYKDDILYVNSKRDVSSELDSFLHDYEGPVPSCELHDLKEFCKGASFEDPRIWLDDREKSTGLTRQYGKRITAQALREALEKKRFGLDGYPDADRRLIYIPDLDPDCVRALAATARGYQVPTLRDALWKHIALQTAISVKSLPIGYANFQFEFHLPYFALRSCRASPARPIRYRRKPIDVSFLTISASGCQQGRVDVIHEAQISIVVCGWDESRWTTYAFVDTAFENDDEDVKEKDEEDEDVKDEDEEDEDVKDEDEEDEDVKDKDEEDEDEIDMNEDPIPSDREGSTGWVVDADKLKWDPREYFLLIVEVRMTRVKYEWGNIIRLVERSVEKFETEHLSYSSRRLEDERPDELKETLDRLVAIRRPLHKLIERFDCTIRAWGKFESRTGDIRYFMSTPNAATKRNLEGIRSSFDYLIGLGRRLRALKRVCEDAHTVLELRLNLASHNLNYQTVELNRRTQEISLDNNRVALESQKTALESQKTARLTNMTAERTNLTAALTLSTNQLTIPLAVVIGYWSTNDQTFSFTRNPKSFIICVAVLFAALKIFNFFVLLARRYKPLGTIFDLSSLIQSGQSVHWGTDIEAVELSEIVPQPATELTQVFPRAIPHPTSNSQASYQERVLHDNYSSVSDGTFAAEERFRGISSTVVINASSNENEREETNDELEGISTLLTQGKTVIKGRDPLKKLHRDFKHLAMPPTRETVSQLSRHRVWEFFLWLARNTYRQGLVIFPAIVFASRGIPPGYQRVKWINGFGERLYDDYIEREPGALHALQEYLNNSAYRTKTVPECGQGFASQSSLSSTSDSSSTWARSTDSGDATDQTCETSIGGSVGNIDVRNDVETGVSSTRTLHLLSCTEDGRYTVKLHQDSITHISHDRQLFRELRAGYYKHRRRLRSRWSLRTVHSIQFMKFAYGGGQYIDVRVHKDICEFGKPCNCVPPADRVIPHGKDYECRPVPPKWSPPIGERLMMDMFNNPDSIASDSILVTQQLPKRTCGELLPSSFELTEAWGIYFREGWDWVKIWWILALGIVLPSLLFGLLWGILKKDVQGAFGVASWWMTGATILLGIVGSSSWAF